MSASYVVESISASQILIRDEVDYLFGALWCIPGIALMGFFAFRAYRSRSAGPVVGALLCSSLLLLGWRVMNTSSLLLDKGSNTARFHDASFLGHDDFTLPLDTIAYAEVRSGSSSSRLMVIQRNGDGVQLGDSDQKSGKGRAAHAINQFVGYSGR